MAINSYTFINPYAQQKQFQKLHSIYNKKDKALCQAKNTPPPY